MYGLELTGGTALLFWGVII